MSGIGPSAPRSIAVPLLAGICLTTALAIDLSLPSSGQIARSLHIPMADTQRLFSLYMLGLAVGQLVWGPVSDTFGRRPVILCGLIVFALASLAAAVSTDLDMMAVARLLQGFGGAISSAVIPAIVRDTTRGNETARYLSHISSIVAVAPMVGPLLGTALLLVVPWPAVFLLLAAVAGMLLLFAARHLPETAPVRLPASAARRIAAIGELLKTPDYILPVLTGAAAFSGLFAFIASAPLILMEVYGLGAGAMSLCLAATSLTLVAGARINARLVKRHDLIRITRGGGALIAGGAVALMLGQAFWRDSLFGVVLPMLLYSAGITFVIANSTAQGLQRADGNAGAAAAFSAALQMGMGALAGAMVASLHRGSAWSLAAVEFCAAFAVVLLMALRTRFRRTPALEILSR